MKLGYSQSPPIVKGSKIHNPDGSRYIVTRVIGSTVTADRIPSAIELLARTLGLVAGVVRSAYRNARGTAKIAREKQQALTAFYPCEQCGQKCPAKELSGGLCSKCD